MIRRLGLAVWVFAVACGGGKPATTSPPPVAAGSAAGAAPTSAGAGGGSSAPRPGIESLSSTIGDGLAAAGTASAYLHALVVQDWAGACATRVRAEREKLATRAGSCEAGLAAMFAHQPLELLATANTRDIRKRGGTIAVDIVQPGHVEPAMTLFLRREDALWLLVDLPDSDAF
jgi:hypothetical protein